MILVKPLRRLSRWGRGENDDSLYSCVYVPTYSRGLFVCRSQSRFLFHSSPVAGEFCLVRGSLCNCASLENLLSRLSQPSKRCHCFCSAFPLFCIFSPASFRLSPAFSMGVWKNVTTVCLSVKKQDSSDSDAPRQGPLTIYPRQQCSV